MEVINQIRRFDKRKETDTFERENSRNPMKGGTTKKIKRNGVAHIRPI
jgi:hypothetical protein